MRDALLAELASADDLVAAFGRMRRLGYRHLDALTPYPLPEIEEALDGRTALARWVAAFGLGAAAAAYALQWLLNGYLYPLNVGGRPPHFPLPFLIITFEMGVLAAALTAFFGVLAGGRLLALWEPIRDIPGIERATDDRFWLVVPATEPRGLDGQTRRDLEALAPLRVVRLRQGVRE